MILFLEIFPTARNTERTSPALTEDNVRRIVIFAPDKRGRVQLNKFCTRVFTADSFIGSYKKRLAISKPKRIGMTGLEPATFWSQTRRATNCATSRKT